MIWVLIAILALGTVALKIAGPLIAGGRQPPAPLIRVIGLLTPALLTSLVISSTFADDGQLTLDARVVGPGSRRHPARPASPVDRRSGGGRGRLRRAPGLRLSRPGRDEQRSSWSRTIALAVDPISIRQPL